MWGRMVMVTEAERHGMYAALKVKLGDEVADILMEHLPPTGWGDVARKQDVVALKQDVVALKQDIVAIRQEIRDVKSDLMREIDRLDRTLKWVIGLGVTVSLGLFAMQAQILLMISRL